MTTKSEKIYGNLKVVQLTNYQWGVLDLKGNVVVPFGKYDWIDGFDHGLARVKIGKAFGESPLNKWGIIDTEGDEVLPVEYTKVWNFLGKNRKTVTVEKDGESETISLHNLNPEIGELATSRRDSYYHPYEEETYSEYAGSYAQEYEGWSDEAIEDVFEGDPDNYWNID